MEVRIIQNIDLTEVDGLSNVQLAERMDLILKQSKAERYPGFSFPEPFDGPYVSHFFKTKAIQQLTATEQRKVLYATFEFILQMYYIEMASGLNNAAVYDSPRYKVAKFSSPTVRLTSELISQYIILSSRMAFERLMDLIHLIEKQQRLEGKSKFNKFKKFILSKNSKWIYFVTHLVSTRRFDEEYRTSVAHGGSPTPRKILAMQEPSSEDLNGVHNLTNLLLNVWRAVIDILDDKKPNYMNGPLPEGWLEAYVSNDLVKIGEIVSTLDF